MIIFGTKSKKKIVGKGHFHCPFCQTERPYEHIRVKQYFSLYFIALIPLSDQGEYVACTHCNREWNMEVLTGTVIGRPTAVAPWSCPTCDNKNGAQEARCLNCGQTKV